MTSLSKDKAMIATNRMHPVFDTMAIPVLFVKRTNAGEFPDKRSIVLALIDKYRFPFKESDLDWPSDEKLADSGDDVLIHLTGRLDGSFRIYLYPTYYSPTPELFNQYVDKALADEGVDTAIEGGSTITDAVRALRMAFGFNWGARYEDPQASHYQVHFLDMNFMQDKAGWIARVLTRNTRTRKIELHRIEIPLTEEK